jgi:hypothetical protein
LGIELYQRIRHVKLIDRRNGLIDIVLGTEHIAQ